MTPVPPVCGRLRRPLTRRRFFTATAGAAVLAATAACSSTSRSATGDTTGPAAPTGTPDTAAASDTLRDAAPTYPPDPMDRINALEGAVPTQWGTDIPGITATVDTVPGVRTLALTFDACGGPGGSDVDHALLDLLHEKAVPATLFLNSRWITANPELAHDLAADPLFRVENHGTRHCPLSVTGRSAYDIPGTTDVHDVYAEVTGNRDLMRTELATDPGWFRCGTAFYDDVALTAASYLGVRIAGFTTNLDAGATFTPDQVAQQFATAPDGAICIGHTNQPGGGTAAGLRAALEATDLSTVRFVHLP
jgi:peptidoglycan/xylan/chitin deacetylase (PgdA/CDA1 family)